MTYQDAPNTYYAGPGMHALMDFKDKCEGMWLGWVAYRAGANYYEMHPDAVDAALHGLNALRRWWVWLFFAKVWLISTGVLGWMLYLRFHQVRGESYPFIHTASFSNTTRDLALFILPALFAVFVTYCRNIDFSLFKRNRLYWALQPLVHKMDSVPNWVLYLIVFCPLFFPL